MIRLLVAAASPVVRTGLAALVASVPGLELVGSFPDLAAVEDLRPDVVLAAMAPDEIPPPAEGRPPAYVLLAGAAGASWPREALRLGIRAMLPAHTTPAGIVAAVEAAAGGLAVLDPHELEVLLAAASPPAHQPAAALTAREREILALLAEGAANKTIAWKLDISEHTVKFHVASILSKLNAGSRAEAVAIGLRTGLLLL